MDAPALWVALSRPNQAPPSRPSSPGAAIYSAQVGTSFVTVLYGAATEIGVDPAGRFTSFLWGETYPRINAADAAHRVLVGGDAAVCSLNGTYVLLIMDHREQRVILITDRVGARRVFSSQTESSLLVSTTLSALPTQDLPLDPTAVGWYLSNGVMHERRTPYAGVRALRHASVHTLTPEGLESRPHWTPAAPPHDGHWDLEEIERELIRLIVAAVRRRLEDHPTLFVSLSGGWDSAALVGILAAEADRSVVRCFSYAHGPLREGSDPWVARRVCERVGFEHRVIKAYAGDFVAHIRDNARLSEGVAPVCDELDAWQQVRTWTGEYDRPALFTGEARHGINPIRANSPTLSRLPARMKPFDMVAWLEPVLPDGVYERLHRGVTKDFETVGARADVDPASQGHHYLNQRLPNALLPWRQHFPGRFMSVRMPLLDYDVMDLMATLPQEIRRNQLFHRAVEAAFPETFAVPRATSGGYRFNLPAEFRTHSAELRRILRTTASRLDTMIPPEVLEALLLRVVGDAGPWSRIRRRGGRVADRILERFRGASPPDPVNAPRSRAASQVLRNLLVLREVLRVG